MYNIFIWSTTIHQSNITIGTKNSIQQQDGMVFFFIIQTRDNYIYKERRR